MSFHKNADAVAKMILPNKFWYGSVLRVAYTNLSILNQPC